MARASRRTWVHLSSSSLWSRCCLRMPTRASLRAQPGRQSRGLRRCWYLVNTSRNRRRTRAGSRPTWTPREGCCRGASCSSSRWWSLMSCSSSNSWLRSSLMCRSTTLDWSSSRSLETFGLTRWVGSRLEPRSRHRERGRRLPVAVATAMTCACLTSLRPSRTARSTFTGGPLPAGWLMATQVRWCGTAPVLVRREWRTPRECSAGPGRRLSRQAAPCAATQGQHDHRAGRSVVLRSTAVAWRSGGAADDVVHPDAAGEQC